MSDEQTAQVTPITRSKLAPGLYVTATPIGNLGDVTLRALSALMSADLVLCEDTRVTRRLLDRFCLRPKLLAYHEHNAASVRPRVLERLGAGESVALVSDAGTPLISDPGYKLVQAAIEAGHQVFPIPGASAVLAALVAAGLPTDRFFFEGFLPAKSGRRKTRAAELAEIPVTLVLYESGPRLAASLRDLADGLGAIAVVLQVRAEAEVLVHGHAREQPAVLRDHRDAEPNDLGGGEPAHDISLEEDLAG